MENGRQVWVQKEDDYYPDSWYHQDCKGRQYGKRGKVITVRIPVKIPQPELHLELHAINDKGKTIHIEREAHSLTYNFFVFAVCCLGINANDSSGFARGNLCSKNTAGTTSYGACPIANRDSSVEDPAYRYGYKGMNADDASGIIIGSDDETAESILQYAIGTKIAHGIGAGQMYYSPSPGPTSKTWDSVARTYTNTVKRFFDNLTANAIVIEEIAQYASLTHTSPSTERLLMVARDILSPTLTVASKSQGYIKYLFTLAYPTLVGGVETPASPLRNWHNFWFCNLCSVDANRSSWGDGYLNQKDYAGTVKYVSKPAPLTSFDLSNAFYCSTSASAVVGVVAGTGSTAVTFNDYDLTTRIANGTSSGQMSYQASDGPLKIWSDPNLIVRQAKTIYNGSPGAITVKEIGLMGRQFYFTNSEHLHFRDVIADTAVAVGESIRPVYDLQLVIPS